MRVEAVLMMGESESMGQPSILPLCLDGVGYSVAGRALLSDINLQLNAGGNTIVLGFNGAGKSLLLRLCHGLLRPGSGSVRWSGGSAQETMRHQAMVFQRPLMLRRSVAANIEYALRLRNVPAAQRRGQVEQALAATGLVAMAGRNAQVLSGGEQQRVALARAWVLQPQVLFLDEPTANLDPGATRAVEEIVHTFRRAGIKVIMTTHDIAQARRLADDVIFLHAGRVLEHCRAAQFFQSPGTPEAQGFIRGELF